MTEFLQYLLLHLPAVPGELWHVLREMSPYLLLGFLVAGLISVFLSPGTVERHLGGRGFWPVMKASLLGLPLPLCSCGVIPVAASLRKHGASRGATVSFLISTPQTGVENIAVTYSLLGGVFAVFAPIATFVSGLLGGWAVDLADRSQPLHHSHGDSASACHDDCCAPAGNKSRLRRIFEFGFLTLPRDLIKPLVVGVIIAALIAALVPDGFFQSAFGGIFATGVLGILLLMVMGIPVYVCATASIPMAWALMDKGVSPGAAFAFLVVGPATNAATIALIWKVMGRKTALIYLGTMAASALGGGMLLDALFERSAFHLATVAPGGPETSVAWEVIEVASIFVLLAVLAASLLKGHPKEELAAEGIDATGFDEATLAVADMDCEHCAEPIRKALVDLAGVESVTIHMKENAVHVLGEALDEAALRKTVESLGFVVRSAKIRQRKPATVLPREASKTREA